MAHNAKQFFRENFCKFFPEYFPSLSFGVVFPSSPPAQLLVAKGPITTEIHIRHILWSFWSSVWRCGKGKACHYYSYCYSYIACLLCMKLVPCGRTLVISPYEFSWIKSNNFQSVPFSDMRTKTLMGDTSWNAHHTLTAAIRAIIQNPAIFPKLYNQNRTK